VRILAVNHTAIVSGGERSLLTSLEALPAGVEAVIACPSGPLRDAVAVAGLRTLPIHSTAGSLKLHLSHTPRALAELTWAALQLRRVVRAVRPDVVYANSVRAGIVASLALRPRRTPFVAHVRDVLPPGRVAAFALRLVARRATLVVANSEYTAESVRRAAPATRIRVLHSPVATARAGGGGSRGEARAALGYGPGGPALLGVVAQLTPWKGQDVAIRALAAVRGDGHDAHLLLVGSAKFVAAATRYDNVAFTERLRTLVRELGVADAVRFLGERDDVPRVMAALDCLLLPSWEEPFGRVVVEGMAAGLPVIATNVGGPPEIIADGVDGLLRPPRDPAAWASAIAGLLRDPARREALGAAARVSAERFSVDRHVERLLELMGEASGRVR
jgi:glycosyltransferase involved in cell wall biosynthesis